jgi:hypothetical protein
MTMIQKLSFSRTNVIIKWTSQCYYSFDDKIGPEEWKLLDHRPLKLNKDDYERVKKIPYKSILQICTTIATNEDAASLHCWLPSILVMAWTSLASWISKENGCHTSRRDLGNPQVPHAAITRTRGLYIRLLIKVNSTPLHAHYYA